MDNKSLLQAWLRKQMGFDMDSDAYSKVLALLGKPAGWPNATYDTAVSYWQKQYSDVNVFRQLVRLLVNNESYFFREPFCFCLFQAEMVKHFSASAKAINVLSVGCSAGQEIYSCAIQAFKMFGADFDTKVKLFGADIDANILTKARKGTFTDWDMRGLSPAEVNTHFGRGPDNSSVISPSIRDKVTFFSHNIFDVWPASQPSAFEFVFCRNLLIHIAASARKECLKRLKEVVKPGGVLVLAAAEIASLDVDGFTQVEHEGYFYLKRDGSYSSAGLRESIRTQVFPKANARKSITITPPVSVVSEKAESHSVKASATAYTAAVAKMKRTVRSVTPSSMKATPSSKAPSAATYSREAQGSVGKGVTGDVAFERNIQTCFEKYSNGEIQEALQYCEMCLKRSSTFSPEAEGAFLVIQGLSYKALGNTAAAMKAFQRSAFLLPLSWTANYFLGECHSAREDDEEAAKSFARAYKCLTCSKVPLVDVLFLEDLPRDNMKSVCLSRLESLDSRHLVQDQV